LSSLKFGFIVPQGWSYDFSLLSKNRQENNNEDSAVNQYKYSKGIAEVIDKYSSIDSIYTYDHFLPYYSPDNDPSPSLLPTSPDPNIPMFIPSVPLS
jgi:hypothetical protein